MIGLASFVRFHAARSPDRPAIAYAGAHISYAALMRRELPRNPSGKILKRVRDEIAKEMQRAEGTISA
jgi:acyl-CoA synthetase (AMP-forming)/AMP-acid ligase II